MPALAPASLLLPWMWQTSVNTNLTCDIEATSFCLDVKQMPRFLTTSLFYYSCSQTSVCWFYIQMFSWKKCSKAYVLQWMCASGVSWTLMRWAAVTDLSNPKKVTLSLRTINEVYASSGMPFSEVSAKNKHIYITFTHELRKCLESIDWKTNQTPAEISWRPYW